jgi:hypothetical protein
METKEGNKKAAKPLIIANPIYDTVFKRLMENQRIANFFLSTILEQPIEELSVLPQEFTYKFDETKASKKVEEKGKEGGTEYFSIFRLDFIATIRDSEGNPRKILIELQKSWDTLDVIRFRKYLGEQYTRVDYIDGKETRLPITTIYILGNNLAGINCPCVKVGRTYTDMLTKTTIEARSEFIENLTHDSYVIQAGRITDVRYTTNLDKILSIFEQRHFILHGSDVMKRYLYQPDDENMTLITDVLHEMGVDPETRKEIEDEKEALRVYNLQHDDLVKRIAEKEKEIEETKKRIEEKAKENTELKGENTALRERLAEMERLLRDKQN